MKGFIKVASGKTLLNIAVAHIIAVVSDEFCQCYLVLPQYGDLVVDESYEEVCRMIAAAQSPAVGMERAVIGGDTLGLHCQGIQVG